MDQFGHILDVVDTMLLNIFRSQFLLWLLVFLNNDRSGHYYYKPITCNGFLIFTENAVAFLKCKRFIYHLTARYTIGNNSFADELTELIQFVLIFFWSASMAKRAVEGKWRPITIIFPNFFLFNNKILHFLSLNLFLILFDSVWEMSWGA